MMLGSAVCLLLLTPFAVPPRPFAQSSANRGRSVIESHSTTVVRLSEVGGVNMAGDGRCTIGLRVKLEGFLGEMLCIF